MRHGKKFNHLGRKPAHRKAMLSNMASSLIMEKRISTTIAKAKALRKYVEPLLTKSKTDDTNSRRVVFSYLQNKESVSELFNEVADKIASRPGGYTRILKTGNRLGDNADMCVIELVDYNDALLKEAKPEKAKTRRSRRGKGGADQDTTAAKPAVVEEAVVEVEPAETEEAVAEVEQAEAVAEPVEAEEAPIEEVVEPVEAEAIEETPEEEVVEPVEVEAVEETPAESVAEPVEAEEVAEEEATEVEPVETEEEETADEESEEAPEEDASDSKEEDDSSEPAEDKKD
jgi:large subunit ribosomal protein L17